MFRVAILLLLVLAVSLQGADKKPPVGPVTEGMVFSGVFKSGEPDKRGILKSPLVANFKLKITSIDGDAFEGTWTWDGKDVTKVDGKIAKNGAISLRYVANIKGKSPAAFDGQAAGKISATKLELRYIRPSGNRIGLAEAKVSESSN